MTAIATDWPTGSFRIVSTVQNASWGGYRPPKLTLDEASRTTLIDYGDPRKGLGRLFRTRDHLDVVITQGRT